jgi:hypothetical protein
MLPCFQTPLTALTWATLEEWLACARKIDRRRASALRNRQAELHVRALPPALVYQCASRATLTACDRLLRCGSSHFCRPPRGQRQHAPQTALIAALANRIAQLDRAEDHASIAPGHNSRNQSFCCNGAPPPPTEARPQDPEEEGREGICDGFSRARDVSRPPVRESPS